MNLYNLFNLIKNFRMLINQIGITFFVSIHLKMLGFDNFMSKIRQISFQNKRKNQSFCLNETMSQNTAIDSTIGEP